MKSRWCSLRMVSSLSWGCSWWAAIHPLTYARVLRRILRTSSRTPITPIHPHSGTRLQSTPWLRPLGRSMPSWTRPFGCPSAAEGSARLYALRASDGTLLWQQPADGMTGLLAEADTLYLSSNVSLQARRASDGSLLWSVPEGGTSEDVGADPVLDQGILYASSRDRLFAVRASDWHVLWQAAPQPTSKPGISSIEAPIPHSW